MMIAVLSYTDYASSKGERIKRRMNQPASLPYEPTRRPSRHTSVTCSHDCQAFTWAPVHASSACLPSPAAHLRQLPASPLGNSPSPPTRRSFSPSPSSSPGAFAAKMPPALSDYDSDGELLSFSLTTSTAPTCTSSLGVDNKIPPRSRTLIESAGEESGDGDGHKEEQCENNVPLQNLESRGLGASTVGSIPFGPAETAISSLPCLCLDCVRCGVA
ncbi:uncharacterized protein EI97DRAFT_191934 [Westerdykella ornata]|uniref:Uncharacterized protein n=1 Tax=Westerdykella ornata TaxID=318751 RepID=A0A6A6J9B5_WESOR|nr:uncharacterized protein EI97DRAFT_191934 [Westerdykella ornata]KAF2272992.1 hypothetical protein EI97DRAFT_191934 [Westerdykella ornata]